MKAWGRLLRLSLAPTAAADVVAGAALGAGGALPGWGLVPLVLGSVCVYHGALALNDWADRDHDAAVRPERPIPSGAVGPAAALALASTLLLLGPILALVAVLGEGASPARVGAFATLSAAALVAVAYDLGPRGERLGPGLLAACRGLNLATGLLFGAGAPEATGGPAIPLTVLALYCAYVWTVSRLGRLEDGESSEYPESAAPRSLRRAAGLLLGIGLLPAVHPILLDGALPSPWSLLPLAVGSYAAFGVARAARGTTWSGAAVERAMGLVLRRLLVFTACCAWAVPSSVGLVAGLAVLAGYPISHALRRAFPPS